MSGYADAYFNPSSPIYVDAITATPYLGVGSLAPAFDLAHKYGGGVFVVTLTSNKEGRSVQHARLEDGRTVAQTIIDEISQLNEGSEGLGSLGLVVGATIGETGHDLSRVGGPILVPGLGAQGGRPSDLLRIFPGDHSLLVPSYSREVLSAGPNLQSLRTATYKLIDELRSTLGSHE